MASSEASELFIGKELQLQREPENTRDGCAVAIVKDSCIVGHVLRLLSPITFHFLARSCNKGITDNKVNRGAGYGVEFLVYFAFMVHPSTWRGYKNF